MPNVSVMEGFWVEFFVTAFLLFTVMGMVHKKVSTYKSAYIVSFVIGCNDFAFSGVTGSSMNPARVFGPALFSGRLFDRGAWIYYVGTVLGGLAGGMLYKWAFMPSQGQSVDDNGSLVEQSSKSTDLELSKILPSSSSPKITDSIIKV